ncbi:trypsin-like peptidase domain-containing protein [Streptomyces sp. NPDC001941]|uniref:trypsin-like serine peptidase n=1 Tax=Streptomyces sp. NPDC001941 TaxID=3154659 RepID=UPI003321BF15
MSDEEYYRSLGIDPTPRPPAPLDARELAEAKALDAYWTPERLRSAKPLDDPDGAPLGEVGGKSGQLRSPSHLVPGGFDNVGVFVLSRPGGAEDRFCTASVVDSPSMNLVLSAAHCLTDTDRYENFGFVPKYNDSANPKPYGIFRAEKNRVYLDARYLKLGASKGDDLDFAFVRVQRNEKNQVLATAVGGGNRLKFVGAGDFVQKGAHLIGYPGGSRQPRDCTSNTKKYDGRFVQIDCDGYTPGTSGSPFLTDWDGRRGSVFGVIGGYKTGGPTNDTSYSSQFDGDISRLYTQAVNNYEPDKGSPLGSGALWKNARMMTAGTFHNPDDYPAAPARGTAVRRTGDQDMVVLWSDGELSLYEGDGAFGFEKDRKLIGPNGLWKNAKAITAGDFTGGHQYDLMVLWADGELTLYKDVDYDTKSINDLQEVQLQKPNALWKHATALATGAFGGNLWPDDLVVTWDDGEASLYTDVDATGMGSETKLAEPGSVWKYARGLTTGDFGGADNNDLMVRWSDGELTVYQDLGINALKAEHRVLAANALWANHAAVISAGNYGGNKWPDDLMVRWSDGELTMYGDSSLSALGKEYPLVPAA